MISPDYAKALNKRVDAAVFAAIESLKRNIDNGIAREQLNKYGLLGAVVYEVFEWPMLLAVIYAKVCAEEKTGADRANALMNIFGNQDWALLRPVLDNAIVAMPEIGTEEFIQSALAQKIGTVEKK